MAAAVVIFSYLTMSGLALSADQEVESNLGAYQATMGFGSTSVAPGAPGVLTDLSKKSNALIDGRHDLTLSIVGARRGSKGLTVWQNDWRTRPLASRYRLDAGRWAHRPGEVTILGPTHLKLGERTSLLSGRMPLRVVGLGTDDYARSTPAWLIGDGTWETVSSSTAAAFPAVSASPVLFWDGSRTDAIAAAWASSLAPTSLKSARVRLADQIASTTIRTPDVAHDRTGNWVLENPFGFWVPAIVLPLLCVVVGSAICAARRDRLRTQLVDIGIRRSMASTSWRVATLWWLIVSMTVGGVTAIAGAWLARFALAPLLNQPMSPLALEPKPFAVVTASAAAGLLIAAVTDRSTRTAAKATSGPSSLTSSRGRDIRHYTAIAGAGAVIVLLPRLHSAATAMVLAGLLCALAGLLAPDILALLLRERAHHSPTRLIAARELKASGTRGATSAAVAAVLTGLAASFLVLLSTLIATVSEDAHPLVLPGQFIIADQGTLVLPPPADSLKLLDQSKTLAGTHRLSLGFPGRTRAGDVEYEWAEIQGTDQYVMSVPSLADAAALTNHPLDARVKETLSKGGIARWFTTTKQAKDAPANGLLLHHRANNVIAKHQIPSTGITVPPARWQDGASGIILNATARRLGFPLRTGAVMHTGVDPTQAKAAVADLRQHGLDTRTAQPYQDPPDPVPPIALTLTALLLALTALAVTALTANAQAQTLRHVAGQLVALGVAPRLLRRAFAWQQLVVMAPGMLLGSTAAITAIALSAQLLDGDWVLIIPWAQLLILLLAMSIGIAAATLLGLSKLRPTET